MDELARLIPFIVAILYFVFGRSKKKQPQNSPKPKQRKPRPTSSTPSLEDILRELRGELAPKPQKKSPPPPPPKPANKTIEIEDHQYDFRPEYEHHADTGKPLKEIYLEIEEDRPQSYAEQVQAENIDARQMIILDAILNRPHS